MALKVKRDAHFQNSPVSFRPTGDDSIRGRDEEDPEKMGRENIGSDDHQPSVVCISTPENRI